MSDRKFIPRLTQELPQQVERGTGPDILSYVESCQAGNERMVIAFLLMAVQQDTASRI